ncbi:MAG: ATP-binding protein [Gammaproteobacteria bacterium]
MIRNALNTLRHQLLGTVRRQLVTSVALVHAVLMLWFVWDLSHTQREMLLQRQVEQAQALAHGIATSSAGWLAAGDFSGLQEIIRAQERYPELAFAMIVDDEGQVVAHSDTALVGKYLADLPDQPADRLMAKTAQLVDAVSPVMLAGYKIGWVRIGLGRDVTEQRLAEVTEHGFAYTVLAIVVGVLMAWLMAARMTRRLKVIRDCADQVEQGRTDVRAQLAGSDEVAHVARAFDRMLDNMLASRRQLELSEERFSLAIQATNDGLWDWNLAGNSVYFSPRWKQMLGYADHEVPNVLSSWEERVDPDDRVKTLALIQECMEGLRDGFSTEFRMRHKNGRWVLIRSQAMLLRDDQGNAVRLVGAHTDITEQKEAEAELIRARNESEKASRAKSEFMASMSHELRTPLNAIIGFSELIELQEEADLPLLKAHVRHISEAGTHLLTLVDEVLDLARIESGDSALAVRPVGLGRLVAECRSLIEPMAGKAGITLDFEPDIACDVLADTTRLKQVLLNLLSNAVKYNSEKGAIRLAVEAHAERSVRIAITDTGPGIRADRLEGIFKPFERFEAKYGGISGTGIGLTIARQLVESMGGRIGVDSTPGIGSTFWVELERATQGKVEKTAPVVKQPKLNPARGAEKRVVYVEDDPASTYLMQEFFKTFDRYGLSIAMSGDTGLALIRDRQPDLVLLDINLPGMDGYEVFAALRASPSTRDIPVIALTANAMSEDVTKIREAGFDDYVSKPVRMTRIATLLSAYLE